MIKGIVFLKHEWNRRFGKVFDEDWRKTKVIPSPDGRGFFRVVYSQKLEEWYLSPKGKARYDKPDCFFCEKADEYHQIDCMATFEHLEVFFNIKFVMRNHLLIAPIEHREQPTVADVVVLSQLAQNSGLSVFGNFQNSGASYPKHVHYQSLETEFPIVSRPGRSVYADQEFQVETLDYPVLAFRFLPQKDWTLDLLKHAGRIMVSQAGTFNLIFYGQDIYLVPRVGSVPANMGSFKFAAAEVCGSIFVRERNLYDVLDGEMILVALKDVCLPTGGLEAQHYEARLVAKLKEEKV